MSYRHTNSKGQLYHLHGKVVTLKGGRQQQIYWFAKSVGANACNKPSDRVVVESPRTGLPLLKKA